MSLKDYPNLPQDENLTLEETIDKINLYLTVSNIVGIVKRMTHLHKSIINHTSFIGDLENLKTSTRIRMLIEGITSIASIPKCEFCGSPVNKISKHENWFTTYCSDECRKSSIGKKALETNLKNNNGIHFNASSEGIKKARNTSLLKYGKTNWMLTEEGKKKSSENFHSSTARSKVKKTMMKKYGVSSIGKAYHIFDEKRKTTNQQKYGGHPLKNNSVIKKIKQTHQAKYGADSFFLSDLGKLSKTEGMIKKYGHENYFSTKEFSERIIKHNMEKYGTPHHLQSPESVETIMKKDWCEKFIEMYGLDFDKMISESNTSLTTVLLYLSSHGLYTPTNRSSTIEDMIANFLDNSGIDYVRNKFYGNKQADFMIGNIAIECNGNYFHSDIFKSSTYHLEKTKHFSDLGIQVIHLFEDEILEKFDIVQSMLLSKLGKLQHKVYARKTKVVVISAKQANMFYKKYHIQGGCKASVHFGLLHNEVLVAVMSFKDYGRNLQKNEHELIRFASAMSVVGGFSKLLNHYQSSINEKISIVSYADIRLSNGGVYEKNGFVLEKITPPSYYYLNMKNYLQRSRKEKFKKSELMKNIDMNLTDLENMSERQLMKKLGFCRIYDCGLKKYRIDNH